MWISKKFLAKLDFSLKSVKNEGYFTRRPIYIFEHISSWNEKYIKKILEKIERSI